MTLTFQEVISFFAEKFQGQLPEEALFSDEIEISINDLTIQIYKEKGDAIAFTIFFGFFQTPPKFTYLKELAQANFLGMQTAGAVFSLDKPFGVLQLRFTCPKENAKVHYLENFEHFCAVADEWQKKLHTWSEFAFFSEQKEGLVI